MGSFTTAINRDGVAVPVNYIAQWNGSEWSALGFGMNNPVRALAVSGTELYAGGDFTSATNTDGVAVPVNCIARWNGNSWLPLDSGISGSGGLFGFEDGPSVRALAVSGDDLYAGGRFNFAGQVIANNVAKWNGTSWSPLGFGTSDSLEFFFGPPPVSALAASGATLYAAGAFTSVTNSDGVAVPANLIAAWDGSSWSALGSGLLNLDNISTVRALAVSSDGNLYAGGLFNLAGGVPVNLIAQWDGSAWSALGSGISGNSFNGAAVSALTMSGTSSSRPAAASRSPTDPASSASTCPAGRFSGWLSRPART